MELVRASGASAAAAIAQEAIRYDRSFRDICASNGCGQYGKCYMCPPCVGEIDALMKRAQSYPKAILYQTVNSIEDSFDYEGMIEAKKRHTECVGRVNQALIAMDLASFLHLGAGGCGLCEKCAKLDDSPCRYPKEALASLEAYGVFVSETAKNAGLRYINGVNTVTYFGIILFG